MNVELNKNFPLTHNAESGWALLSDIQAVALCMPGAEITEVLDENNFKGKVKLKLGPVKMAFDGDINVVSIDADTKRIQLVAKGKDNKGTTSASMDLTANIEAGDSTTSVLLGDAQVTVDGKLAGFGARMMAQVSDQILEQFADNFREKLNEAGASNNTQLAVDTSEDVAASTPNEIPSTVTSDNAEVVSSKVSATNDSTPDNSQSKASAPTESGNEINGFKFAWNMLVSMVTGLFKRKG